VKIEAILFDLDNTLIFFDEKEFYEAYVYKLSQRFQDLLSLPEFAQKLMISTQLMTNNDGKQDNAKFFINDFSKGLNIDKNEVWKRFDDFYNTEFVQFKNLMKPNKEVYDIIIKLQKLRFKLVIASNPMLPEYVQQLRLNWAGLEGIKFDLITHVKNSSYCKPNLNYYKEICIKIGVNPPNCLMVGNDAFNDMIASRIGMKTFFVSDGENNTVEVSRELVGSNKIEIPEPDYAGKLKDLLPLLERKN